MFSVNIKPYMLYCLLFLPTFVFLQNRFSFKKLYNHEIFWILSYLIILFSFFYANDFILAFQLVLGQLILVCSFILFRSLIDKISIEDFEKISIYW